MVKNTGDNKYKEYGINLIKFVLFFSSFSIVIGLFCNVSFFERYFSDGNIIEMIYLAYIFVFRLIFIILGVIGILLFFFKRTLISDLQISLPRLKYANEKRLTVTELFPFPPKKPLMLTSVILVFLGILILYGFLFQRQLFTDITPESGILESLTVIFYFLAAYFAISRIWQCSAKKINVGMQRWWLIFAAFFFIFIAMEETNWGQMYFSYKGTDIISKANFQNELGIHNIPLPFERNWANAVLHLIAASLGLIIPAVLWLRPSFARFAWAIGLPLPSRIAKYGFILATLIPTDTFLKDLFIRRNVPSEVREFICALSFIFLIWHLAYTHKQPLETKE